jgi:hypothetical protein
MINSLMEKLEQQISQAEETLIEMREVYTQLKKEIEKSKLNADRVFKKSRKC